MSRLPQFIDAVNKSCDRNLFLSAKEAAPYSLNVGGFQRQISGVAKVKTAAEVQALVKAANQLNVPLFPFSQGANWGYGSKLPVHSDSVLVDLSAMNQILNIDKEMGFATVEPGVTQKQLSEELERRKLPFFLDVTGSGAQTSILGNALERGIAYQSLRVQQLSDLEVVLGNETLLKTGFSHYTDQNLHGIYPYGLGPSLTDLFFQSNFGIVLKGTVRLIPTSEKLFAANLSVSDSQLPALIETVARLRRTGVISGIPHIADKGRSHSTILPLLNITNGQDILDRVLGADWTLTCSIRGTAQMARLQKKIFSKELQTFGRIFWSEPKGNGIQSKIQTWLISKLATQEQKLVLKATDKLRGLHFGQPSDDGIHFLQSPACAEPDLGKNGVLLCTPIGPLKGGTAKDFIQVTRMKAAKFGFFYGITLNLINEHTLEAVITIHFSKENSETAAKARQCVQELSLEFKSRGYYPYRINIDQMKDFISADDSFWQTVQLIKSQLDPNDIISPGRYGLSNRSPELTAQK